MSTETIRAHYAQLLRLHGDSPQAVQYSSRASQEKRFDLLMGIGELEGKSILDFGCGAAHLLDHLNAKGIQVDYHGTDIVEEFISLCRDKHPNAQFGPLEQFAGTTFDYIMVGGVFNNKMDNNRQFYQDTIRSLFAMCRLGLSFNMMSAYVDYQDPDLFYEHPEAVFTFLKTQVTPFVALRNDYEVKPGVVPFDFTVYAYREGL